MIQEVNSKLPIITTTKIEPRQHIIRNRLSDTHSQPNNKQFMNNKLVETTGTFKSIIDAHLTPQEVQVGTKNISATLKKIQIRRSIHGSSSITTSNIKQEQLQKKPTRNFTNTAKQGKHDNKGQGSQQQFALVINLSNHLCLNNRESTFKAYVEKGNNGLLVKSIIKRRWWWYIVQEKQNQKCNLYWSQWYNKDYSERLDQLKNITTYTFKPEQTQSYSNKHLKKLKPSIKTDSVSNKQENVAKIINLDLFTKLNLKISKDDDSYFVFNKKIKQNTEELISTLVCFDNPLRVLEVNQENKVHSRVEGGLNLHSKKLLFSNMKKYYQSINKDPFQTIPLTFHIKDGRNDQQFIKLMQYFDDLELKKNQKTDPEDKTKKSKNIWIVKPGQNSNRGNGISVVDKKQQLIGLVRGLETSLNSGIKRSLIIQKYLENPFLIQKRKFDMRCYILITTYNGLVKGYWYDQGYIRTTSEEFTLDNIENKLIHLTNDAVQKKGKEYGKFQSANKMSFHDFEYYLEQRQKINKSKFRRCYEQIKCIARDLINSVYQKINQKRKEFAFELFGLDFMLDSNLKPWLIEANSNPCLDTTGPLLGRLIPQVIQNVFKVAVDPIFPPPSQAKVKSSTSKSKPNYFQSNKFLLIFDELQLDARPAQTLNTNM